jgi:Mn2+/Fe2+ NRAMP family transporter
VYFGAFLTNVVSFFIIVSTAATLYKFGIHITDAAQAAEALRPLAGNLAELLFGAGLFAASMLGAFILPVATAYALCEAFGWEAGFDTTWKTGKVFYSIILLMIVVPSLIVLIPGVSLVTVMIMSQDINGILLPFILIFVMKIVNNKRVNLRHRKEQRNRDQRSLAARENREIGHFFAW